MNSFLLIIKSILESLLSNLVNICAISTNNEWSNLEFREFQLDIILIEHSNCYRRNGNDGNLEGRKWRNMYLIFIARKKKKKKKKKKKNVTHSERLNCTHSFFYYKTLTAWIDNKFKVKKSSIYPQLYTCTYINMHIHIYVSYMHIHTYICIY